MSAEDGPTLRLLDLSREALNLVFAGCLRLHGQALDGVSDEAAYELRKRDPRRTLPLVSRGMLAATLEADALWAAVQLNVLTLSADRVPLFVRWLAAHAASIRRLVLYGRAVPTVEVALAKQFDRLAAAVQAAGAAGLETLDLPRSLAAPLWARLKPAGMPRLRSVGVDLAVSHRARVPKDAAVAVRVAGPGTSRGGLGTIGSGGGEMSTRQQRRSRTAGELNEEQQAALNLLQLPALEELLVHSCFDARILAVHPSAWPRLRRLHFSDARDVPRGPALPSLASLASITSLRFFQRDGFALPGPLTALRQLAVLHAAVRYRDDPLVVSKELASMTSLGALWLQHLSFEEPACLSALPRLRSLGLVGGQRQWADVLAALAAPGTAGGGQAGDQPAGGQAAGTSISSGSSGSSSGGQPLSALRALHLESHSQLASLVPEAAWEALARLGPGLTRLEMPFNRMLQLPRGRYLECLKVLDLSNNSLADMPGCLTACSNLRALNLCQQEAGAPADDEDASAVFAALPSLRVLATTAGHYSEGHLSAGLRSPAEAAHLERVRALAPGVRVTNRQGEWERAAGRLAEAFEVGLRRARA